MMVADGSLRKEISINSLRGLILMVVDVVVVIFYDRLRGATG